MSAPQWYAIRVKSNRENVVATAIEGRGYEPFLPSYETKRVWSDRVKSIEAPLFPGYVFCRLNIDLRLPVLQIPGVVSFVEFGRVPAPVDESEIAALQQIAQSGASAAPWPFLAVGQRVRIENGALRNLEGLLIEVRSKFRLVVSVSILQRSVAVEVDRDCVMPIFDKSAQRAAGKLESALEFSGSGSTASSALKSRRMSATTLRTSLQRMA